MKRIFAIILLLTLAALALTACGNKQIIDLNYKFDRAIISLPNGDVVAWRQTAEFCNKYLLKGRKVAVEGSIQTRSYDAQDGSKRYVTEIIADSVEALGGPKEGEGRPAEAPSAPPRNEQQRMDTSGFTEVDDEKLPWEE